MMTTKTKAVGVMSDAGDSVSGGEQICEVCLVSATNTQLILKVRPKILTFGLRRPASPGMRRTRLRYSLTSLSGFPPADDKKPKAISTFARASHTSLRLLRNSDNIWEHTAELIGTCQSNEAKVIRTVKIT